MPRGYGMGRGARWWQHGRVYWAPGYPAEYAQAKDLPGGVAYIGPCRCGFGPHAYYRTAEGAIVHASSVPYAKESSQSVQPEEALESEVERLRVRVEELEAKLREVSDPKKR